MLTRRKCCCNVARVAILTRRIAPCPYGRVKVWDSYGATYADVLVESDGIARVPLPAGIIALGGFTLEVSEVPRTATATATGVTLNIVDTYQCIISDRAESLAGFLYMAPATGYGSFSTADYPQAGTLSYTDSVGGTFSVPWVQPPTGSGYYRATSGGWTLTVAGTGSSSLRAQTARPAGGAGQPSWTCTGPPTYWTPTAGGVVDMTCSGVRNQPGYPNLGPFTITVTE